jgi:hypothetical protein
LAADKRSELQRGHQGSPAAAAAAEEEEEEEQEELGDVRIGHTTTN